MAKWLVLNEAGSKQEPIAINLDLAISMKQFTSKTRIEFGDNKLIDVVESISAILNLIREENRSS
jgi:hypothetical protein